MRRRNVTSYSHVGWTDAAQAHSVFLVLPARDQQIFLFLSSSHQSFYKLKLQEWTKLHQGLHTRQFLLTMTDSAVFVSLTTLKQYRCFLYYWRLNVFLCKLIIYIAHIMPFLFRTKQWHHLKIQNRPKSYQRHYWFLTRASWSWLTPLTCLGLFNWFKPALITESNYKVASHV